jgi:hypothetical protein
VCPNDAVDYGFAATTTTTATATRAPPPGRGLNVASLPPVKCYRCGGPNHMARYAKRACPPVFLADSRNRDCLAPPYAVTEDLNGAKAAVKTCYRCKKDGHVRLCLSAPGLLSSLACLPFALDYRSPRIVLMVGSRSKRRRILRGELRSRTTTPGVKSRIL